MNNSEGLHWSFDYNYGAQNPHFTEQLVETFLRFYAEPKTDRIECRSHRACLRYISKLLAWLRDRRASTR